MTAANILGVWLLGWAAGAVAADAGQPPAACQKRAGDPARTIIERPCGTPFAVLTDGAVTVRITGAERRFSERTAGEAVVTRDWVRVLPQPFAGRVDAGIARWLDESARDGRPDVLAIALQYVEDAPPLFKDGLQIAGDADYGPLNRTGQRQEGADFNDYLGIVWHYPGGQVNPPEPDEHHALDCSGFIRMVWGYRLGLPLSRGRVAGVSAIPRRTFEISETSFGVVVIPDRGTPTQELGRLQAGDLVFFDAEHDDGGRIDHVGMVLGWDTGHHLRYVSSRKSANGPTFGDTRGPSILDGTGLYARTLRAARRF